MQQQFKFIIDARKAFIKLVDELSIEELNHIPPGFNNNIIWNLGHIVVSTPVLCYVRTGVWADTASIKYVEIYKKGTKPSYTVTPTEVDELKKLAVSTIEQLQEDYDKGVFATITPFSTSTFGTTVNHIDELIATTAGHDNVHFGYAIAQRRLIKSAVSV